MQKATANVFEGATARRKHDIARAGYYGEVEPGISVRTPTSRDNYDFYRPGEKVPTACTQEDYRNIMMRCRSAYERVGVIKSVIDMMSEFGAEGVEIVHPDAEPNNFYKAWQRKVNIEDRAERYLNWLYKSGQAVVRRKYGQIRGSDFNKLKDAIPSIKDGSGRGRIPIDYVMYDPATIELVGGSVGALSNDKIYALRVPLMLFDGLRSPRNPLEKRVYDALPVEIKDGLQGKTSPETIMLLEIPKDKLFVGYYKKDDSEIWAKSFIYSILDSIYYNDKLKLARVSALDGWYNVIRLWKLGDHTSDTPISPDPEEGNRLANILEANTGGGAIDVIWGSAIALEEFYPPVEKLANFEEDTNNILLGLGVPESLVGGKSSTAASSNASYLGLKNLIKRLEAGRRSVRMWLESEIDIIQKEMGFRKRPEIRFANSDLHDEATYFNLLLELVDRNILSDETILERINELPEIEKARILKENKDKESKVLPQKAGPYHKPDLEQQQKHELTKIREQGKVDKENTENSSNLQKKVVKRGSSGRPSGKRDTYKRTRSPNKVKASYAKLAIEGGRIYNAVEEFVRAKYLDMVDIKNTRQLSAAQEQEMDEMKLALFANVEPFTDTADAALVEVLRAQGGPVDEFFEEYDALLSDAGQETIKNEDKRLLRIQAYARVYEEYEDIS